MFYSRGIDGGRFQVAKGQPNLKGKTATIGFQVSPKVPLQNLRIDCDAQSPGFRFTSIELSYLGILSLYHWNLPSGSYRLSRGGGERHWQLESNQPVESVYDKFPQNYFLKIFLIISWTLLILAWYRRDSLVARPAQSCANNAWLGRLVPPGFLAVIVICLMLAAKSPENMHPDESQHISATRYYMTHWLPISIDDPQNAYLYDHYGMTRINSLGIEYFLAGKLAVLVKACGGSELFSCRFFNPFLLAILFILTILLWKENSSISLVIPVLFLTPQVWYTFSYMNDDGFPFFLSVLFLVLYLRDSTSHLVLKGAIIGMLCISKANFLVFVLFSGVLALTEILVKKEGRLAFSLDRVKLRNWGVVFSVALLLVTARGLLDLKINGPNRGKKIIAANEKYAAFPFKLSTVEKNPQDSIWLKAMRKKGVPASDLLTRYNWLPLTAASFVAVYGYYTIPSPGLYYALMAVIILALLAYVLGATVLRRGSILRLIIAATFLLLITSLAFYRSWDFEFQPQGRHLFPFLAIAAWLTYSVRDLLDRRVMNTLFSLLYAGGLYSLLATAFPALVPAG